MADYNEQVEGLWDKWTAETGQDSGDPDLFVDWAMAQGKLVPHPQSVKKLVRKQVTNALRQSKRWDEEGGFTYRAKQSVTLFENGVSTKHYFDTDNGGTPTKRQKSVKERRDGVAHDIYRAHCDVQRMNKMFPDEPELNFYPDFKDDIEELREAEQQERKDGKKGSG